MDALHTELFEKLERIERHIVRTKMFLNCQSNAVERQRWAGGGHPESQRLLEALVGSLSLLEKRRDQIIQWSNKDNQKAQG